MYSSVRGGPEFIAVGSTLVADSRSGIQSVFVLLIVLELIVLKWDEQEILFLGCEVPGFLRRRTLSGKARARVHCLGLLWTARLEPNLNECVYIPKAFGL